MASSINHDHEYHSRIQITDTMNGSKGDVGLTGKAIRTGHEPRATGAGRAGTLPACRCGGAYDGPLGVVSGFAAIDLLRARGFVPPRPVAVAAFCEEEGGRFGLACLGSRLLAGVLSPETARELAGR